MNTYAYGIDWLRTLSTMALSTTLLLAGCPAEDSGCQSGSECASGICTDGVCQPVVDAGLTDSEIGSGGRCSDDNECRDDHRCVGARCLPWEDNDSNTRCSTINPEGVFSPVVQCAWTEPPAGDPFPNHRNILATPVVVDFNFDDNPETRSPSVVFVTYDGDDPGPNPDFCGGAPFFTGAFAVIRVVDGATCEQQFTVGADADDFAPFRVRASSPVAVADINLDGRPDIVAPLCGGGIAAYEFVDGTFKPLFRSPLGVSADWLPWGGPSIHDLDDDGKPEIVMWGVVWDNEGQLLDSSLGEMRYKTGLIPIIADLDGDGRAELVDGEAIYEWDITEKKWDRGAFDSGEWGSAVGSTPTRGFVAIGDFGTYGDDPAQDNRSQLDGVPELAVVSSAGSLLAPDEAPGTVRIQTLGGRTIFGPIDFPSGGMLRRGGPPTIGDFDSDGRAELAAAEEDSFSVYDPDCQQGATVDSCATRNENGILWTKIAQDRTSNMTGSSIFDFEGDGSAEVVYADECFTRVYKGNTGTVVYSAGRSSCTWYENPIVADVDGDFNSELVVPANTSCSLECLTNSNHEPFTFQNQNVVLDPLFAGLRCQEPDDCLSGTCTSGICRCASNQQCPSGYACAPPPAGTAGNGNTCRSFYDRQRSGLYVYSDVLDRWVNSRNIWNQHAYAITNVNEDGTIPKTSEWLPNWKQAELNNFRQNRQEVGKPLSPDLTVQPEPSDATYPCLAEGTGVKLTLRANVCNRGAQPVPTGLALTFYRGPATSRQRLCTAKTDRQLTPGVCAAVTCDWTGAQDGQAYEVTAIADDDGSGRGTLRECYERNNSATLGAVKCAVVQ